MKTLLPILAITLLMACNTTDERLPLLYGDWRGIEWSDGNNLNEEKASKVTFSFREDLSYSANFGNQEESGDFVFRDAMLYTTASGDRKVEKVVGVSSLDDEQLVLDMNRSGNPEKLVLVRVE